MPSQEDFENFFQRMSHPFQGLPTKIMITGSTIIIRIIIEVSVFVVLPRLLLNLVTKPRYQTSLPNLVTKVVIKPRYQGCY